MNNSLMLRRKIVNSIMMGLTAMAAGLGLMVLALILVHLLIKGAGALNLSVFLQDTPPPNSAGGLRNAIVGSLMMSALAVLMGAPIGVLAGTYMAEYGRNGWLTRIIRFINDILLSAPSIIVGLFVYEVIVVSMGGFSGIAGAVALAILVIPIVVRTTEDMLRLVPDTMREAGMALGLPRFVVIRKIIYRAARAGLVTGILLATARILGETAPLLFTALNNQFFSTNLGKPMASLPNAIFQFALSPYENWQNLAWAGALLITMTVLTFNIVARLATTSRKDQS